MTASKVELRTLSDLFSDLESAEFGNRIEYGTFDGVGGPYRIVFMPYFNSTLGELYDKDGSVVYHRECYGHQDIMKFASNCTEMYSNFNKFIFATYRSTDDKQRMFIDRLDAFSSYHTKNGWWDTFCLSTDDLEETGLYLCELRGYFKDKDGYPISNSQYEKDIYKLRLLYKFIEENKKLTKLNITKNPIKDKLIIKNEPGGAANFNEEYIKRDNNDNIIINCFFSFLIKIKNELFSKEDYKIYRNEFVIIFDCKSLFNLNSETYPFGDYPIIFKELL